MYLDNLNPEEILPLIEKSGGFLNMDDHTIRDFYSHSNYIEIWEDVNEIENANIPTFEGIDWNSKFGKALKDRLETTASPDNLNPRKGHDKGTEFHSKDKPPKDKNDPLYKDKLRRYNEALDLYQKSLDKKYEN